MELFEVECCLRYVGNIFFQCHFDDNDFQKLMKIWLSICTEMVLVFLFELCPSKNFDKLELIQRFEHSHLFFILFFTTTTFFSVYRNFQVVGFERFQVICVNSVFGKGY
jgi:hypothetical protein